ncbi:potassium channel family protein [Geobacter sp. DSM 9736]|uniref:potassium channel family protein n=1 Tax=Geobacter sp. DSM 9736 TaxID=1277350 RepID=UPI000B507C8B|nr:potassium channel family protein [Geobacter sp. DSM 9736]SNB46903.1 voltage-gated potassium channel [Geobacter sp. DSM 9736]
MNNRENGTDQREKSALLDQLSNLLEGPVTALGFMWLMLMVIELVFGLTYGLEILVYAIWGVFLIDFLLRLYLAPRKALFLRQNVITAVSLIVPALRLLRIFRFAILLRLIRSTRGLRLLKVVGTFNRTLLGIRRRLAHRGIGYVLVMSLAVALLGAAAMYAFEREGPARKGFADYGDALWWAAMVMTTMGSEFWPRTAEGRLICLFLALYAFAVFGYTTATIASFILGPRSDNKSGDKRPYKRIRSRSRRTKA